MIFQLRRSDHITDALASLHWLRVPERIQFKIAVLEYKVLHGTTPRYLGPLVRVSDLLGRRCFRSASTQSDRLVVPSFKLYPLLAVKLLKSLLLRHGTLCQRT